MSEEVKPALVTTAQADASTSEVQKLQARYRELHKLMLQAEAGDYTALVPNYDKLPPHERQPRLLEAAKARTHEIGQIMFKLNSASTGPKKSSPAKPKKESLSIDTL